MFYVALLRGINVGGKNMVPMSQLAKVFAAEGCQAVQTYIQSGNVLFTLGNLPEPTFAARLSDSIEKKFGLRVPVIVRSAAELRSVLEKNPYLQDGAAAALEDSLHVYFLSELPAADRVLQVDPARSLPDTFQICGREIYLFLPNGMGRTKLTNAYFDSKLKVICTARNWRTLRKLAELIPS